MGSYSEASNRVFEVAWCDRDRVLGECLCLVVTCRRVCDRNSLAGLLSNPGSQLVWLKM